MATIVAIPEEIKDALKKFRAKSPPLILYIDKKTDPPTVKEDTHVLDEDEEFSIETLAAELPNAPRYIILSYKPEGETFGKVILINWIPVGCDTASSMFHVDTLSEIERLARNPKVIQVDDGEEGLTREILDSKLRR